VGEVAALDIRREYARKINGLGEIYEIMSVERLRKRLRRKYGRGILFLSPNKEHSGRGLKRNDLIKKLKRESYTVIESGFVDCPPWGSRVPEAYERSPFMSCSILLTVFKYALRAVLFLERWYTNGRRAHVIYAFVVK